MNFPRRGVTFSAIPKFLKSMKNLSLDERVALAEANDTMNSLFISEQVRF